jgi:hypothetical protein
MEMDFGMLDDWKARQVLPHCLLRAPPSQELGNGKGGYCYESRSRACNFAPRS